MWVELATRITTQTLHYRSGEEETAAESVHGLFKKARELMAANPSAADFNALSLELLNDCVRPYTARWHGWMTSNHTKDEKPRFKSEVYRRKFREELKELQGQLLHFEEAFRTLAAVSRSSEGSEPNTPRRGHKANLGRAIEAGIGQQVLFQRGMSCDEINQLEREFVSKRRSLLFNSKQDSKHVMDAVGLAFSGGGIRSATVCLGVVQVLAQKKLLAEVDFLSTVSGGGYLGTFLSSFFHRFPCHTPDKTLSDNLAAADDVEPAAIRHLRNNSKYLLHGGAWGKLNMAALLLSGLGTNILMVLPVPLIAALVLDLLNCWGFWGDEMSANPANNSPTGPTGSAIVLRVLGGLLAGAWFFLTLFRRVALQHPAKKVANHGDGQEGEGPDADDSVWAKIRGALSFGTVILLVLFGVAGVLFLVPSFFHLYKFFENPSGLWWHPSDKTILAILGLLPFLSGLAMSVLRTGRVQKFFSWLLVLSGPLLCGWSILFVGAQLGLTGRTPFSWRGLPGWLVVLGVAAFLLIWSILCVDINSGGPHGYYRDRLCECYLARRGENELTWWQAAVQSIWSGPSIIFRIERGVRSIVDRIKKGVMPVISWIKAVLSRLAGGSKSAQPALPKEPVAVAKPAPDAKTGRVGNRLRLPLSCLAKPGLIPYHLVNAIVNLPASANQELRGRDGDFFLISPLVCGSPVCGYFSTEKLSGKDKHVDLGTAMAISGAAAAPNMGFHTLPQFRFLMALFNVRLGYWIPNVGIPKPAYGRGVGVDYLLREMAGHMNENLPFLNLSDGGHIENLGVYELVRRKSKFIICVHGGASLGTERGDLQRLQRYLKIDLGIDLEYDLSDLQPDAARQVRAYATLVKVKYAKDEVGWMIYLKPAITGGEPPYVLDLRCAVPEFPNEGLLDQAYSEEKFEAYRALGKWLAESLFRDEIVGESQPGSIREWFQKLADNLLPDNDEAFAQACPKSPKIPMWRSAEPTREMKEDIA
jgi:hypothetical protein